MVFVVAGATGNVGSAAVRALAAHGQIRALTRAGSGDKVAPLKDLANVQIVEVDISDASSLASKAVFDGVHAAFLTCGNFRGQVEAEKSFIDAAVAAGVKYLCKLGTIRSYTATDSPVEYGRFHGEIEAHLEKVAGGMKWTVLCPNWFMSNHLADIWGTLPKNIIAYPLASEAKNAIVDPRDIGEIAAAMMVAPDPSAYHGLKLDIAGPEPISMGEIAALYSDALGRPIVHVKCQTDEWVAGGVQGGLPEWLAQAVSLNFAKWEAGTLAVGGGALTTSPEALAAAPPKRTMSAWIREWAPRSPPPAA